MATSGIAKRRAAAKAEGSRHYTARRQEIVRSAAEVFRTKGLASTSIDDIAKAAGVDRASLYYYVGSKKELFDEVVFDAVASNVDLAERIAARDDPAGDKLVELIEGVLQTYAAYYPHLFVFIQESAGGGGGGRDAVELQRRFDRALIAIIEEGMTSGAFRDDLPPRLAAYGVVGMLNWTHRWFNPDGPVGASEVGRAFATLAVEGLRSRA